jgi:catechol 2,3-dioxygenase-like lactoylglutathione lyase family enzyme
MKVQQLIPILNVSNMEESFAWFEKLGWKKAWDWGDPPDFGSVCNGDQEIFLSLNCLGCRGGPISPDAGDDYTAGVWMCWLLKSPVDVDAFYNRALEQGVIATKPPTDQPFGIRECHIRHPDGHTFRVGASTDDD